VGIRRHLAGTDHPDGAAEPPTRGHRSLGASAAVLDPGHRLRLVALVPHRRQNYPNTPPPTRATAISEVRQRTKSLRDSPLRGGLREAQ
jgi:hypothetical protein